MFKKKSDFLLSIKWNKDGLFERMQLALVFFLPLEFAHWGMKLKEPWKRPIIVRFQSRGYEKVLLHDTSCTTMRQMGSPISMFLTRGICYTWGWASRGWPAGYCFCKPWCQRATSTKGWQWLLMPTKSFVRSGKSTPSCGEWTFTPSEGGGPMKRPVHGTRLPWHRIGWDF